MLTKKDVYAIAVLFVAVPCSVIAVIASIHYIWLPLLLIVLGQ